MDNNMQFNSSFSRPSRVIITVLMSLLLIALGGCTQSKTEDEVNYEYGVFYLETQGEFVVPVGADDPAIYSWSTAEGTVKGDIGVIWTHLKVKVDLDHSFDYLEVNLLNHLASEKWQLDILEISSINRKNTTIRTAHRYIFKRAL